MTERNDVESLISALKNSEDWGDRVEAAWTLGETKDRRAVEPLIQALGDEHWRVRWRAAWALGEIGDERAVEPLIRALEDKDSRVRESAARALGEIGDKRATEPLIRALGDEDDDLREEAARALGEIRDSKAVEPLIQALRDKDPKVRESAARALGEIGDKRAVEPLIQTLRDGEWAVRESATRALGRIGKPAVKPLIRALEDEDPRVRESAARALGEIRDKRAVEPLIRVLREENPRLRWGAAKALGEIGDAGAVEPLIQALGDEDPRVREEAAHALGKIRDRRAVDTLIETLRDEDSDVREAAAESLGEIGDKKAVEPLIRALEDEYWLVRGEAAESLGEIGDKRAVEPLIQALEDKEWEVRERVTWALGEIGDSRAAEPLIRALEDEEWEVRENAAEALRKIGKPAVKPLLRALEDENPKVRERAAQVLGEIGDKRAVGPLIGALRDEESRVRENAASSLGRIGRPAVKPLLQALEDEDSKVREGAAIALGKIGDKRAVEPLVRTLGDEDSKVREGAANALGRMGYRGVKKIEDYGIIGDLNTCALIGRDGSIDWCCLPYIESPSVFACILDVEKGGHFAVHPTGEYESEQRYVEETNVLQTLFRTPTGRATLTDFMPVRESGEGGHAQRIYRRVACTEGFVDLEVEFKPRFNYARSRTQIEMVEGGVIAREDGDWVFLTCPLSLEVDEGEARGGSQIKMGEEVWLVLEYRGTAAVDPKSCAQALENTIRYWRSWIRSSCLLESVFDNEWCDLIQRSALVLKLLTHHSGALYAAPTTSIPEKIGGSLNWDYRFAWIRDASFTVQAFYNLGYVQEAKNHLRWLVRICEEGEDPSEIQPLYGLYGELDLKETVLEHLSGYRNSRPVRIGNAAAKQRQLDIYGELVNAVYEVTRYGEDISREVWEFVKRTVDYVCEVWNTPDAGIWESRGEPRHYVYSKLMCWVALDRGIKIAKQLGDYSPLERWIENRDEIKNAILKKGFSRRLNSFVQYFGSEVLDATSLLIPLMGLLPFSDPRVQGTINATMERLMPKEGLVYRFEAVDKFYENEGVFVLCSFWLVYALALSGRISEAEKIFRSVLKYLSPLGLLSEEVDPKTGELLGNYPQAYSHIGLINSTLYLGRAKGKRPIGPEPLGSEQQKE
ncbi:MAG: HEAT repeat domain-containing protein [Candidatus Freyrarchaeum guaymaensis]